MLVQAACLHREQARLPSRIDLNLRPERRISGSGIGGSDLMGRDKDELVLDATRLLAQRKNYASRLLAPFYPAVCWDGNAHDPVAG